MSSHSRAAITATDAPQMDRTRSIRIGLNLTFLGERAGGIGRYALELPGALLEADPRAEVHIFTSRTPPAQLLDAAWAADVRWVRCPVNQRYAQAYLAFQFAVLPLMAAARRVEVLHSLANVGPAMALGVATVVSLHDTIWLRPSEEWGGSDRWQRNMTRIVAHQLRHADQILTVSNAAAETIIDSLKAPAERVYVTALGVRRPTGRPTSEQTLRGRLELGESRVVLCVAQKQRYKNMYRLIRALPELDRDTMLVLPGFPTAHEQELRELAEELGVSGRVRFPDWLSDEDLEGLYALCNAVALPSLVEGFGLPVLEAMVRGVPVACSSTSALGEVAGDAALQFDPKRQDQVTDAVRRLLDDRDLAQELVRRGRERAAEFSWRHTGAATIEGYKRALAARQARRSARP